MALSDFLSSNKYDMDGDMNWRQLAVLHFVLPILFNTTFQWIGIPILFNTYHDIYSTNTYDTDGDTQGRQGAGMLVTFFCHHDDNFCACEGRVV